jgi:hypothetical protein
MRRPTRENTRRRDHVFVPFAGPQAPGASLKMRRPTGENTRRRDRVFIAFAGT